MAHYVNDVVRRREHEGRSEGGKNECMWEGVKEAKRSEGDGDEGRKEGVWEETREVGMVVYEEGSVCV